MSQSNTLRNLSGLPAEPAGLGESALIMIDCQNTYREGVMALSGVEEALKEGAKLLARARDAGVPIFHIQHDAGEGSPYDLSTRLGEIADEVAPREGERVIVKTHPNAFVHTQLHDALQESGKNNLVLAGFMTHMCVNSTARGAFNLGYAPAVVAKASATRDLPRGSSTVSAQSVHDASLASISDLFGIVVDDSNDIPA